MDLIAIGTLIASLIAAVAAVWAVVVSRQQLTLTEEAAKPQMPLVVAQAGELEGRPDWLTITVSMQNRANVPLDLLRVTIDRPEGVGLLRRQDAEDEASAPWNEKPLMDPMPADRATRTIAQTAYMNVAGARAEGARDADYFTILVGCPLTRLVAEPEPRLTFELRWRDHATKTFSMTVNVIKPKTA